MKARLAGLLLCTLLAFSGSTPLGAQGIGGLIKKKVDEVKKSDKPAAQAAQTKASFHTGDVLPITKTLLDGFKVGLNTEIKLRAEFQRELASFKTPEQYKTCQAEVAMSPEGQKILGQMTSLPDNTTAADLQRVIEKMDVEMKAELKKKCGEDINIVWPNGKRADRLEEIERKAAAAVDPAAELPIPDLDGEGAQAAGDIEVIAPGITPHQYQVLKERVIPFCLALKKGSIKIDGKPVSLPGSNDRMFYMYTAEEAETIAKYCDVLMALLAKL